MASEIKYTLEIDDNGFVKVVKQATDGVDGLDKAVKKTSTDGSTSMKSLTTSVRDVTLAFNGAVQMIGTVYNQMKEFTDASNAQVEAQRTLTEEQIAYSQTLEEQTGVSDVVISQAQSMLKVMGLNNEETQQATKYTADLVNQGKSLEDATKKAAAMITHNYGELGELIPAIKTATTEQEKQSLAMDYFARISDKSIEKMNGVEGAEIRMKNAIQDAKEEFGAVINKALIPLMNMLTPVVKLIGDNMPIAVGLASTAIMVRMIPAVIALGTQLGIATGGVTLITGLLASLAVGGAVTVWASMSNGAKETAKEQSSVNTILEITKKNLKDIVSEYGNYEKEEASVAKQLSINLAKQDALLEAQKKQRTTLIGNIDYEKDLAKLRSEETVLQKNRRDLWNKLDEYMTARYYKEQYLITGRNGLLAEEQRLIKEKKDKLAELQPLVDKVGNIQDSWYKRSIVGLKSIVGFQSDAISNSNKLEGGLFKVKNLEQELTLVQKMIAFVDKKKEEQDVKNQEEEDKAKQRNATSLSLIKQYQDKVSQIGLEGSSLAIQQETLNNENTLNNLKEMLNQKKITYEAYYIAIKSQEQLHSEAIKAILDKENEDVLARIADANIAVLKKQQELAHSQLAIQEQYNQEAMKLEDEKVAVSDAINEEMEDMLVASTKTKTDDLILAYNRDVNAHKDMLAKEKISQQEFDAWFNLRNKQFEEDSIASYKEIAQQVGDILKDAFKDLFNFDNEAWEEQKQALQEQREQSDLDYQDRIEKINAELQVESSTAEERRALLREKAKLEKDYAKEKAKLSKQEEEQDALKNDRFKEMTKNAIKASIDMLAAKGAAAAFAQVMMNVPFPANIVLAPLAYAGAYTAISAAKMLFRKGGYTGDGNPDDEAGIVHKKEFVATAETTDRVGIPALEALQDGKATIVPITQVAKPDTFTGSVNTGYVANAVQALSMNLVGSDNSNSRETVIINNSDLVTITKKIEQIKSENKNMSTNKTTRSYR